MKKLIIATFIAGAMILSACNGNSNSTSNGDSTNTNTMSSNDTSMNGMNNSDTSTATVDQNAADFAQDAATGGMMEVQLGNLAQKNSSFKAVKDYGKMLVDDHTNLNNELKSLAGKKNINLPATVTSDQQNKINKLAQETGTTFDKDFISMAIDDHQKDIDKFKKAGDNITDPDFKEFIVKALPTLQKHLDQAKDIKNKM